ncbi:helix-turn-helix domain-containing protein [Rhizobium sp. G21]|uniref:helix-turn-helix domain-containing protein n=1 Tax=Rhizobium sp. G21 TaxID=2758439 RepID=UPI001FEEF4CE|nr:helix-turn-helix domain-containing protein [Rhizobium sp. G21]
MTRLDMADYLGLTIETVSRTITSLIGRGVISQRGRHDMRINKYSMLARLAGDGDDMRGNGTGESYARQAVWPA